MKLQCAPPQPVAAVSTGANTSSAWVPGPADSFTVTTDALTTAANTDYVLTVFMSEADQMKLGTGQAFATVRNGSNNAGQPILKSVVVGFGAIVITIRNMDGAAAFNGTLTVKGVIFN